MAVEPARAPARVDFPFFEALRGPVTWWNPAMRTLVFSTRSWDRTFLERENGAGAHHLTFVESRLDETTVALAKGHDAVAAFVNDVLNEPVLLQLREGGVRLVTLRCAGFNNVDLTAAQRLGVTIARVPEYSPFAVAEHTVALLLTLNRKIHRAHARVREGNFALDGLLGVDLNGRTVGLIGTGKIGLAFARIMKGFGCRVLAVDPRPGPACAEVGLELVALEQVLRESDVVSLHCPLTPQTRHLIDARALSLMKPSAMLLNTSRGAVIDTVAVIDALKARRLGGLAIDVYEEEADLFFRDLSSEVLQDDVFARLLTFPNVVITGHQGFFTEEALTAIARTTLENLTRFEATGAPAHAVSVERLAG